MEIQITSIKRHRCPSHLVKAGQSATLAIKILESDKDGQQFSYSDTAFCFRRGQVILSYPPSSTATPTGVREFEAELHSLNHKETSFPKIKEGIVYCGSVRQQVKVVGISGDDWSEKRVRLRFSNESEWISSGSVVILYSGNNVRLIGRIVSL